MLLLGGTLNTHADNESMTTSQDIRAATTMHENARRLEWSRPPGAKIEGVVRSP
jgi:hypothetical protein